MNYIELLFTFFISFVSVPCMVFGVYMMYGGFWGMFVDETSTSQDDAVALSLGGLIVGLVGFLGQGLCLHMWLG